HARLPVWPRCFRSSQACSHHAPCGWRKSVLVNRKNSLEVDVKKYAAWSKGRKLLCCNGLRWTQFFARRAELLLNATAFGPSCSVRRRACQTAPSRQGTLRTDREGRCASLGRT